MYNIAFDSHKRYTLCVVQDEKGNLVDEVRLEHERGCLQSYLGRYEPETPVAVETIGNWYWIVDEIEKAGLKPLLVHALRAKNMMCNTNKTDRLDALGLNHLQRTGTLPVVWIPGGECRDKRELTRSRMYLVNQRTGLKNRIHAALGKYALEIKGVSDIFGARSRELLKERISQLPKHCRLVSGLQLKQVEELGKRVAEIEKLMREVIDETEDVKLLRSIPGIGFIFGTVISMEIGDIHRFVSPQKLASYAGTVPRVHSSGGRTRYGRLRPDVNRYLKWAFCEAANVINLNKARWTEKHVVRLYNRIYHRKGHPKAIGAVARHLAEAAYCILKKKEPYKEPI